MMFLLTCDKKLTKSQLSPTHAKGIVIASEDQKEKVLKIESMKEHEGGRAQNL